MDSDKSLPKRQSRRTVMDVPTIADDLKKKLGIWAQEHGIEQTALNALLGIVKRVPVTEETERRYMNLIKHSPQKSDDGDSTASTASTDSKQEQD